MEDTIKEKVQILLDDSHKRYNELAKRQQEYIDDRDSKNARSIDIRMQMIGIYIQRLEDILK